MNGYIVTLSIIAAVASTGAMAINAIIRKRELARAREQAASARLSAVEDRLANHAQSLNLLWQEVNFPPPKNQAAKDNAPKAAAESPSTKHTAIPCSDPVVKHEYAYPRHDEPAKPIISRRRTNTKNYRGHGKGDNARLRLTDEQMVAMMEMADRGMNNREIAEVFDISKSTVQRILSGGFRPGNQKGKA